MNTSIITKVAKFTLIGNISACFSFIAKHNYSFKIAFTYLLVGATFITLIAVYWEGRRMLSNIPTEEGLTDILNSVNGSTKKREYLFPAHIRLEIIIGLLVVLIFSLIGAL